MLCSVCFRLRNGFDWGIGIGLGLRGDELMRNKFACSCDLAYICDMAVYTIYCLIDPQTNYPYYVGTMKNGKYPLDQRLRGHISQANCERNLSHRVNQYVHQKNKIVYDLEFEKRRPIIKALLVVTAENVDFCEQLGYEYLTYLGFNLLQSPYNFYYTKIHAKNGKNNDN